MHHMRRALLCLGAHGVMRRGINVCGRLISLGIAAVCCCVLLCVRPAKYFSVDRVFRNEAVDRTHLAEFHQVRLRGSQHSSSSSSSGSGGCGGGVSATQPRACSLAEAASASLAQRLAK